MSDNSENIQIYPTWDGIPIPIPLISRWTWLIIGCILLLGGIIYGNTSHQITYQTIKDKRFIPYIVNGGTDYLQEDKTSTYFLINENDFFPRFSLTDSIKNSAGFTFIARSDSTNVDVSFTDGTHLTGQGYTVEQITLFDSQGLQQVFSTSEYTSNPHGLYENHWILGGIASFLGFLIAGFCLLYIGDQRKEEVVAITLLITFDAIKKYVPEAMTQNGHGNVSINGLVALSKLFSRASDILKETKLKRWVDAKKLHIFMPQQQALANIDQAVEIAVVGLLRGDMIPREQLEKSQVYTFERGGPDPSEKAYLVIIGKIPSLSGKGIRFRDPKP